MQTQTATAAYRRIFELGLWLLAALVASAWYSVARAAPVIAPVTGEIQFITINNPADHWSGGTIVVGGTIVTIPRNLLIDLPANRLTLQQIFEQAPAACVAAGETGLAKGDTCNLTGMGGMVSLSANRTNGGNVIAGDVFIEKGVESVTGQITYINYNDGYFIVNGNVGDPNTGVMVRLNDPDQRHTIQQGLGCAAGSPNCSADPRFTLDGNNYVNVFTTGYPICIPSTVVRSFANLLNLGTTSSQASADGSGDVLCPTTNRSTTLPTAAAGPITGIAFDSRRFAPIMVGDHIVADGNFETVNGVRFLSAHTTMVSVALTTDTARPDQPDYFFFAEVFMEAPGFQNQRMRAMWIGFTTVSPADVMMWSLHYDPVTNSVHEFPLASTAGCDAAAGVGSCSGQAIRPGGWDIFRIRYDVDFGIGARADLDPCVQLQADPRFGTGSKICPNSPILDPKGRFNTDVTGMMGIMQPVPHEIQGRTGRKMASLLPGHTPLITVDIKGAEATNGQYLFPFGMNLGGIEVAEMSEIDLGAFNTPLNFSGIPWNLDRRLSPGGCFGACETTPQPLDPFPFEGLAMDPRLQAPPVAGLFSGLPQGLYTDPNFSATPLTRASNRILSFVNPALARSSTLGGAAASGNFGGDLTLLSWPPADPAGVPIAVTPVVNPNFLPVAVADTVSTVQGVPVTIAVLANDTDPNGNVLSVSSVTTVTPLTAGAVTNNGTNVTFSPNSLFTGLATFTYTLSDGNGGTASALVSVTVTPGQNLPPVANADSASTTFGTPVTITVLANDTDPNLDPLSVVAVTNGTKGTVANNGSSVSYTPNAGATGTDLFTYTVADGRGGLATGNVTVTIGPAPTITVTTRDYIVNGSEWRVAGTDSTIGATVTVRLGGPTGAVIGTAVVSAARTWTMRIRNSAVIATAGSSINVRSSDGATLTVPVNVR